MALAELERRKRRREKSEALTSSFRAFIRESWHVVEPAKPLIDNWHLDAVGLHMEAIANRQIRKLVINIPPGFGKSLLGSVQFSAWMWARSPQTRILCGTYATALTVRDSIKTRGLIESLWFQDTFKPDWSLVKRNEDMLTNTRSGFRQALSVDSAVTGFRGDGQIIDDVMNATEAHSEPARINARRWLFEAMSSRFDDMRTGWRVVIGQRLHEADPYGELLKTGEYVHLMLPSEYEAKRRCVTSIGWEDPRTEEGELLFPELFTKEVIGQAKRDLGSYAFAGQHQQRPAPARGGLFRREWWRRYDPERLPDMVFDSLCISIDASFKGSIDTDFVAIHVWAFLGAAFYLVDRVHRRMGFSDTKHHIREIFRKYPGAHAKLIEDKANGPAIIDELGREFSGIIAVEPEGSKLARASAASPYVEAGNVYLPANWWGDEIIEEASSFPNAAHDDDVDAMTQMLIWRCGNSRRLGLIEWQKGQAQKMITAGALRKPLDSKALEACPLCATPANAKIVGQFRCQQCGHQWGGPQEKQPSELGSRYKQGGIRKISTVW